MLYVRELGSFWVRVPHLTNHSVHPGVASEMGFGSLFLVSFRSGRSHLDELSLMSLVSWEKSRYYGRERDRCLVTSMQVMAETNFASRSWRLTFYSLTNVG